MLRYVLTANAPETKDNDFTWRDFQARNNSELVAILGNFVNRAVVLTHKYFNGAVPARAELREVDIRALEDIRKAVAEETACLEDFHFRDALKAAMEIARTGNRYLQETEPWKTAKTDMERTATVLNVAVQMCANLAVAFEPFLPFMSEKLRAMLSMGTLSWDMLGRDTLVADGTVLSQPELLFEKIEDDAIQAQLDRLERIKKENQLKNWKPEPVAAETTFDDFMKMDIRVGTVLECEKVKKSNKLLRFRIDDGMGGRTILSGIAQYYEPEELVGKQVCFIANFPPRKMMGQESQGMILSAVNADGSLKVISPSAPCTPGAKVG